MDKPPIGNILRTRIEPLDENRFVVQDAYGVDLVAAFNDGLPHPALVLEYLAAQGVQNGGEIFLPIFMLHRDNVTINRPTLDGGAKTSVDVSRCGNNLVCSITDTAAEGEIQEVTSLRLWNETAVRRWLES